MKTLSVSVPSQTTQRFMMIVYPLIAYEHFENLLIHKDTLMKCCALCVQCAIGMVVDSDVLVVFVEPDSMH